MKNNFTEHKWHNLQTINSKTFVCWNCNSDITSNQGYYATINDHKTEMSLHICHKCNAPNIFDKYGRCALNPLPGKSIQKLPEEIRNVYNEARACMQVEAHTAAVMLFRKILMNMAVKEQAKENQSFKYYVEYLCNNGFVHKRQTKQADKIRRMGNDANHEIIYRTKEEAKDLLRFIEFLLLNNYEFADEEDISIATAK